MGADTVRVGTELLTQEEPVESTARFYDEGATAWHGARSLEDRAVSRRDSYERFASLAAPGGLVLDLGCGSGLDVPALGGRGFRVIGLDISPGMLGIARTVPGLAGRLLVGDMRALPLAAASVGGVWADGSLHHLPKIDAGLALREIARVLVPGGLFFASVERGNFEGFVEVQEGVAGCWYSYYEAAELQRLFAAVGFQVVGQVIGGAAPGTGGFVAMYGRKR